MNNIKRIMKLLLFLTIIIYFVETIRDSINAFKCSWCSAPWYLVIIANTFIFGVIIIAELLISKLLGRKK